MSLASASEVLTLLNISSASAWQQQVVDAALISAEAAVISFLGYDPEYKQTTEFYPQADSVSGAAVWDIEGDQAVLLQSLTTANLLQLRRLPVRQITDLRVDRDGRFGQRSGSFGPSTVWTEGEDFWIEGTGFDGSNKIYSRSGLLRAAGSWPTTPGSIKVTYWAGYLETELAGTDPVIDASAIRKVVVEEAARRARRVFANSKGQAGPLISERLGDYGYSIEASSAKAQFGVQSPLTPESQQLLGPFVNLAVHIGL